MIVWVDADVSVVLFLWRLRISETLNDGFEMTFYCGLVTRWVFLNMLICDTSKRVELSCINFFGKCLEHCQNREAW